MAEYNLSEINARIDNFRQLISCLNVLGRVKAADKIETPKQMQRPWKIQIQDNSYGWRGWMTRLRRTFGDHQYREDNMDYIKVIVEKIREDFIYLFQYISRYVVRNNKEAIKHWSHTPLMTFSKPSTDQVPSPPSEFKLKLDETQWLPMRHMCPVLKKDEKRTFAIYYRLCKCIDCSLSPERTAITRVGELLVQGLASMANAIMGLDYLKDTDKDDDGILESIHTIQTDLNNMTIQYVNMAIHDEDQDCMIRFNRAFIDTSGDEGHLP